MNKPNRPIVLVDLDDTLFQTIRKMRQEYGFSPVRVGALDRTLKPRSFLSQKQVYFVDWLLTYAELIPVTARGSEELSRVTLPFSSWSVTTHGAVIYKPCGTPDHFWKDIILTSLSPYTDLLYELQAYCSQLLSKYNIDGWARLNFEYDGQPIYLVMKHRDSNHIHMFDIIVDKMSKKFDLSNFYVHRNGNNVAWLPMCVKKGMAAKYLIELIQNRDGFRPVLGFGDSISDYSFLQLCDWWGMPQQSQIAILVAKIIEERAGLEK